MHGAQGTLPSKEEIVRTRNLLLSAEDLRQPMNLSLQLMKSSGLASDVGEAISQLLLVGPLSTLHTRHAPFLDGKWHRSLGMCQAKKQIEEAMC